MITVFAAFATQVLFIVFPGVVLHRAVATRVLSLDKPERPAAEIREGDLVLFGILPGLGIIGTIGTALAVISLFRVEVFVPLIIGLMIWRSKDVIATLKGIGELTIALWRSISGANALTIVSLIVFAQTVYGLALYAQMPSDYVDVWSHQLPLAQSLVANHRILVPQIEHPFYGNYPIFFNVLFAEGLLFVNDAIAASVINSIIYLGFLLSLLGCARYGRAVAILVLAYFIVNIDWFSSGVATPMTDMPRTCFSVLALVFAYRYFLDRRLYFLAASGLLAGAAVAGKYTEMLAPGLIVLSLLPELRRGREGWRAILVFAATSLPLAVYPYIRNWIALGNPIYPFLFGHPGLTDAWMADLILELTQAFDPADRNFSHDLTTLKGWQDFFFIVHRWFFENRRYAYVALALIAAGLLFLRRNRLHYPVIWTAFLLFVWYTKLSQTLRYALPFYLLMLTTAYLAVAWAMDEILPALKKRARNWRAFLGPYLGEKIPQYFPAWLMPKHVVTAGIAFVAIVYVGKTTSMARERTLAFLPLWSSSELAQIDLDNGGLDSFLKKTRPGFEMYRYIGEHNLATVFQPFDSGTSFYQAAYNKGHNGNWMLSYRTLPTGPGDFQDFVKRNNIRYFIVQNSLRPVEIERLGPENMQIAKALIDTLLPSAQRILVDSFGWELYQLNDASLAQHR